MRFFTLINTSLENNKCALDTQRNSCHYPLPPYFLNMKLLLLCKLCYISVDCMEQSVLTQTHYITDCQ